MLNIVVDFSALLLGSENGGAKIMALQLIKRLAEIAPENHFVLLGTKKNEKELLALQSHNIKVTTLSAYTLSLNNLINGFICALFYPFIQFSNLALPFSVTARIKRCSQILRQPVQTKHIIKLTRPDVLFYPFTAVNYKSRKIPSVSVVYDLQFHYYPYFFTQQELYQRRKSFHTACKSASKIICISQYVKQTILDSKKVEANKVTSIYIQMSQRLHLVSEQKCSAPLQQLDLQENQYVLYPANFWLHKNHQLLFIAFNLFRSQNPQSSLKLVCTGGDNHLKNELVKAIDAMGLSDWIKMPGFLEQESFSCLLSNCKAVIFPSLFEGFGMPIIEAMAYQKPVLCSNLTCLPEIAGDAAILFDPRKPAEIASALAQLENNPTLVKNLIDRGNQRVLKFNNETEMAREYLAVFDEVVRMATLPK